MARYKVLRSVAHGLGHSFVSTLNWGDDDYVMGNLLRCARQTGADTFWVDLSTGVCGPESLTIPPVKRAAVRYAAWFPKLVERHLSDMRWVSAARLEVRFDLSVERPSKWSPEAESPFVCRVEIVDDRGKVWSAEQRDWWFPEPPRDRSRRSSGPASLGGRLWDLVRHFLRRCLVRRMGVGPEGRSFGQVARGTEGRTDKSSSSRDRLMSVVKAYST